MLYFALLLFAASSALSLSIDSPQPSLPVHYCGSKYGCFALPNTTCLQSRNGDNCSTLVTYRRNTMKPHSYTLFVFQRTPVNVTDGFWTAVGFSQENGLMPNTSIVECRHIVNSWPNHNSVQTTYAVNATRPPRVKIDAVHPTSITYWGGGILSCSMNVDALVEVNGELTVDLGKPTFLLLAHGLIRNDLLLHHNDQGATPHAVTLGDYPKSEDK